MAVPHLLVGAGIGRVVRRPVVAFGIGVASHFALDALPHVDAASFLRAPTGQDTPAAYAVAVADVLVGVLLLAWAVRRAGPGWARAMVAGALGAMMMDAVEYVPVWGSPLSHVSLCAKIFALHHAISGRLPDAEWPVGFSTQIIVALLMVWALSRGHGGPRHA